MAAAKKQSQYFLVDYDYDRLYLFSTPEKRDRFLESKPDLVEFDCIDGDKAKFYLDLGCGNLTIYHYEYPGLKNKTNKQRAKRLYDLVLQSTGLLEYEDVSGEIIDAKDIKFKITQNLFNKSIDIEVHKDCVEKLVETSEFIEALEKVAARITAELKKLQEPEPEEEEWIEFK